MKKLITIISLSACLSLFGCIRPYQPNIQQGNIINNSDLSEIRYGMSKQEVLFLLGTPMIIDPFNESRWEYYYSKLDHQKRQTDTRKITAIFDEDKLVQLSGDVNLSTLSNLEPSIEDKQHGGSIITEPTQKEKGLFSRLFKQKNK